MKKLLVISSFLFLLMVPLTAQEEPGSSSGFRDGHLIFPGDYFMLEKEVSRSSDYVTEWYKHPNTKLASFSASDKKVITKNGTLVGFNQYGDTQFIGNYQRNQLYGEWKSWYHSRKPCDSGRLVKNVPDGEWKGWFPNGQLKFVYHFNAKKLAALKDELRKQPKTKFFIIATKTPAVAAEYYSARRIFGLKTAPEKSVFLSKQISHSANTAVMLKTLVDNNTSAIDSECYIPPFTEALLHGNYIEYYADGKVRKSGIYINGLREGMWEEYSESGIKAVGTYRHSYPNGEWRYYDQQGKLLRWKRFNSQGKLSEQYEFDKKSEYRRG